MSAHKINFYLGVAAAGQPLLKEAKQLARMQQAFTEIAPPLLASHCTVGGLHQGKLTFFAANAAIAAKLKHILPSLLTQFQTKGYEVTVFSVAVQAAAPTSPPKKVSGNAPQIGREGVKSLENLATELKDTPLKEAVASLLKRANKAP